MESLFHYCQGESHKSTEKECQDCAYAEHSETLSMAIVCDGHGGEPYFRSKYGSKFAVDITKEAIRLFVNNMWESTFIEEGKRSVFEGAEFTAFSAATTTDELANSRAHKALTWLFASIISQWNEKIAQDARARDLDDWEKTHVEQKYLDAFLSKRQEEGATFEKTYGCTLMAYVQTQDYWFAFHIGDGKFVSMRINEANELVCEQPIPWDDRCFLNKTTSLCDSNPLEEFRYCYQGNGQFPLAVFLGSDGLDDSYGDGDNLINFYIQLFKIIIRKGYDIACKELKKSLPLISKVGSKDDMSVATIYDQSKFPDAFFVLTDYQMGKYEEQFNAIEDKIVVLNKKIEDFGNPDKLDRNGQINLEYAQKDLDRAEQQAKRIKGKKTALKCEITKFRNSLTVDGSISVEDETLTDELINSEPDAVDINENE